MRKQYHFRRSSEGSNFDAWDVHRLIELSRELAVERVEISQIREVDEVYWFDEANPPTVRAVLNHVQLVEEADSKYPIILGSDGRLMDGMHRVAKALRDGVSAIDAVRFPADPEPDFRDCRPEELEY